MRLQRYGAGARCYDVLSGERPVYRVGRERAIDLLRLRPGDRVLDVGCGTGLNLPLLHEQVGSGGRLVGVDASGAMLGQAARRVERTGWTNVDLVHADAGDLATAVSDTGFDAVLFTYSLSIIDAWRPAWRQAVGLLRDGGRAAVVDMSLPRGRGRLLGPLARLACYTGGADPHREPWRPAQEELGDVTTETYRAGHVVVVVGTVVSTA